MLILGHAGITLGAAIALDAAWSKRLPSTALADPPSNSRAYRFSSLAKHIDIRVLLVGSLLPDIIDKPVGHIIFRNTFSNGRIFCHTLLFLLVITLAGLCLYKRKRKIWLLILSCGTFTHLIFDQMWLTPHTLFWPLYGWNFPKEPPDLVLWLKGTLTALVTVPSVYITEIIGALILGAFCWHLIRRGQLGNLVKTGKVD